MLISLEVEVPSADRRSSSRVRSEQPHDSRSESISASGVAGVALVDADLPGAHSDSESERDPAPRDGGVVAEELLPQQ